MKFGPVEKPCLYGFGERTAISVVEFFLEGSTGHEVGVDGFDAVLVEGRVGFSEGEGVGGEERLAGLAFGDG